MHMGLDAYNEKPK